MGEWMAGQSNAAPVIIKRKKVIAGGGHHGGAWKVAYADFVTAMMAFFMLMWLLNATTEKQRKGIADYFNPTIPINRISGGGDGAFGGDSVFAEETMAQNGTGANSNDQTAERQARGEQTAGEIAAQDRAAFEEVQREVDKILSERGGESRTMEQLLRHVVTKVTDEGLVIELFDLADVPLFDSETATPTATLKGIAALLAEVLALAENQIAVNGHVHSYPMTLISDPSWDLSAERAQAMRALLQAAGLPNRRMARVTGLADRKPVTADPTALRNNRLEIILLRKDR
jgi:chemotaxis protein MotB